MPTNERISRYREDIQLLPNDSDGGAQVVDGDVDPAETEGTDDGDGPEGRIRLRLVYNEDGDPIDSDTGEIFDA